MHVALRILVAGLIMAAVALLMVAVALAMTMKTPERLLVSRGMPAPQAGKTDTAEPLPEGMVYARGRAGIGGDVLVPDVGTAAARTRTAESVVAFRSLFDQNIGKRGYKNSHPLAGAETKFVAGSKLSVTRERPGGPVTVTVPAQDNSLKKDPHAFMRALSDAAAT